MKDDKTVLERFDDFAKLTGVPQLQERFAAPRRRPMRWSPLVMIVVATLGYGTQIASSRLQFVGMMVMAPCIGLTSLFLIFGPLRRRGDVEEADEREQLERNRADLFAFAVTFVAANVAFFGLGFALLATEMARQRLAGLAVNFVMYQFILITTLPTLYASWSVKQLQPDSDDDFVPLAAGQALNAPRGN